MMYYCYFIRLNVPKMRCEVKTGVKAKNATFRERGALLLFKMYPTGIATSQT
jgi:hypothetical protein